MTSTDHLLDLIQSRPGSKHHLIVDRRGTPLAVALTGGVRHDVTQLPPLRDPVPPIRDLRGRPRRHPRRLFATAATTVELAGGTRHGWSPLQRRETAQQ